MLLSGSPEALARHTVKERRVATPSCFAGEPLLLNSDLMPYKTLPQGIMYSVVITP